MQPTAKAQPLISLVALVRDEADDLRRLLHWHRELYDEAIVVDTGSADNSVAVAAKMGAQVHQFAWQDDFSAARNHGLQQANGQWVLVLDCDEVISPGDFAAIRKLCSGVQAGWVFEQWNYCREIYDSAWFPLTSESPLAPAAATGFVKASTCRLFPVRNDLFYLGMVHELPDDSLLNAGIPLIKTSVAIHHYGHLVSTDRQEAKKVRYAKLLRKKLQLNPQDVKARYEMAVQLSNEGSSELAQRLLKRTISENPHHPETHRARLLLGRLLIAGGTPTAAVTHMETAVRKWPALREGWIDTARLHLRLGHWQQVADYAEQGGSLFPLDAELQKLAGQANEALADKYQAID